MTLKGLKKIKKQLVHLHFDSEDLKKIDQNAKKYTEGNRSAWIRYASLNFKPKKKDLDEGTK